MRLGNPEAQFAARNQSGAFLSGQGCIEPLTI